MIDLFRTVSSKIDPQAHSLMCVNVLMRPRTVRAVIAENVQKLREVRALTFDDISRRAHIGKGTITRIAHAQAAPTADIVGAIANVFGLPAWALLVPDLNPLDPPAAVLTEEGVRRHDKDREAAAVLARMLEAVSASGGTGESPGGSLPGDSQGRGRREKSRL